MPRTTRVPDEAPLVVDGLVKRFDGVTAVDGVSFHVPKGTIFCLVGPNGAGKTTTLSIAQGLRRPTAGTVRMFGQDPNQGGPSLKRRLGVLPQHFFAFDTLTVRENVEYFADVYGADTDVDALLASLGLADDAQKKYKDLSGGTKRRVGIATALANDPELVFLDEPTAGVDPVNRRRLWDIVLAMKAQGRSVVFTTHYMDEAERLADEVAIIYRGRLVARGPPAQVKLEHGGKASIRVSGLEGRLPAALARRRGIVEAEGVLTIPLESLGEGPAVLAALVRSRRSYREISIREPTLDDAFVRLVGATEA